MWVWKRQNDVNCRSWALRVRRRVELRACTQGLVAVVQFVDVPMYHVSITVQTLNSINNFATERSDKTSVRPWACEAERTT